MSAAFANKLNKLEKLKVKSIALKMHCRGYSQFMIRDALKRDLGIEISQPMVGIYLRQAWKEAQKESQHDKAMAVAIKLEQLRDVRREAWTAWERSSNDAEKLVQEFVTDSEAVGVDDMVSSEKLIKRIETREGRLPDNAYLNTILRTLKDERELLGLDPEKPTAQNNFNLVVAGAEFWQGLAQQVAAALPMSVESRVLQAVESQQEVNDADITS